MESLTFQILMPLAVCFCMATLVLLGGTYAHFQSQVEACRKWAIGIAGIGIVISFSHWLQAVI